MLALSLLVISIALADSVNPSTVGPALYLAAARDGTREVLLFVVGVFGVNTIAGLLLALGPGHATLAAFPRPAQRTTAWIELAVGTLALLVALALWLQRQRVRAHITRVERRDASSSLLLGAGIAAVELPTAFPYFAVIAAVIASGRTVGVQAALIVVFNISFVAPLVAVAAIRRVSGARARVRLARLRAVVDRHAPVIIPAVVLVAGVVSIAVGASGLV